MVQLFFVSTKRASKASTDCKHVDKQRRSDVCVLFVLLQGYSSGSGIVMKGIVKFV